MSRPSAYKGNDPYIFVSYCHKDDTRVWPLIEGLQARGMRVWYDEGIEWGSHWDQVIFDHLSGCAYVVAFVTNDFLKSENCMDEISYAKDEQKGPFIVFLDNIEMTGMMKFRYGRLQALNLAQFDSQNALLDTLCATQALVPCRGAAQQPAPSRPAAQQPAPSRPSKADLVAWNNKGYEYNEKGEFAEAVKWYRKAAEQGHTIAQFNLGLCYEEGKGVVKDEVEAAKWYRKAAEQGYARSQYQLGAKYASGRGVRKDDAEAVKWYRKAAEQEDKFGAFYLALHYAHGLGIPKDKTEALKWFIKADEYGHPWAKDEIKDFSWKY